MVPVVVGMGDPLLMEAVEDWGFVGPGVFDKVLEIGDCVSIDEVREGGVQLSFRVEELV
jgi:hypothetical protein